MFESHLPFVVELVQCFPTGDENQQQREVTATVTGQVVIPEPCQVLEM